MISAVILFYSVLNLVHSLPTSDYLSNDPVTTSLAASSNTDPRTSATLFTTTTFTTTVYRTKTAASNMSSASLDLQTTSEESLISRAPTTTIFTSIAYYTVTVISSTGNASSDLPTTSEEPRSPITMATATTTLTTSVYLTRTVPSRTSRISSDLPTTSKESPISTSLSTSSSASYSSSSTAAATIWSIAAQITNIAQAFKVTRFGDDQRNMKIVDSIPADPSATDTASMQVATPTETSRTASYEPLPATWLSTSLFSPSGSLQIPFENQSDVSISDYRSKWNDDDTSSSRSMLEIFYPEGSINPSNSPRGGAQFYASPIDISSAENVTFSYSVFFPVGFEFVKGGKLPGLYGGHSGCSGGNSATSCFSTRLMWRSGGEGELYLYAPKDKQTSDLCSDSHSVCESTYGISVGRGTFSFTPGKWTYVSQTATLNTPGEQDGYFTLDVNGERVIDRKDIFYRDKTYSSQTTSGKTKTSKQRHSRKKTPHQPKPPSVIPIFNNPPRHKGGLLGLVGLFGRKAWNEGDDVTDPTSDDPLQDDDTQTTIIEVPDVKSPVAAQAEKIFSTTQESDVFSAPGLEDSTAHLLSDSELPSPLLSTPPPVGFVGMFFSTFFGGHDPDWACPRDQYVWFRGFSMSNNG
ncbi:hypothetical protein L218DRAFT_897844 [Marasmius fiardii PR-910]|nr:hypothetical protein L218DRAFT_897844 [Marasmius fiardii PR-910]